jgi:deoxycytidylate deaminase
MSLASVAKFRSNFPGKRQIGAAILSSTGEVISVASIRAPNPLANTAYEDEQKIQQGYQSLHDKIKNWEKFLSKIKEKENLCADCDLDKTDINELKQFIKDSLEYHPCTHAEISAILDAAKLGVSVRNATLYTTTFPCHLCAKNIITAGIKRVVYLAAYEKSKNKDLYPELISLDNAPSSNSAGVPFQSYVGIGPKRFSYVYDLDNEQQKDCE